MTVGVLLLAIRIRQVTDRSFAYLVRLPLMASTIFAGQRATSIQTAFLSFAVVWTTQLGIGPFAADNTPIASVFTAQIFLVAIQLTLLVMATESSRRRDVLAELEGVFAATLDAVLVVDEKGTIRRANPPGQQMMGGPLIGISFARFLVSPPDDEAMAKNGSALVRCRRLDGEEFWGEISEGEVVEESRRIRKAIVIRDATGRIEADLRVEKLRNEFISHMTHELRTPLTSIVGYSHLLLENAEASIRPQLEAISSSAIELSGIVDDILEFKRTAEAPSERLPFDLSALVDRLTADLAPVAASHEVSLHVISGARLGVEGDHKQLGRAITNLISNAIKYSHPGGKVTVEVGAVGSATRVQVSDDGIGIPPEDQARLFERFFRASNAVAGGIPGTGLGLAYVRQVTDGHGGEVVVDSTPGAGTTVTLTLPSMPPTKDDIA